MNTILVDVGTGNLRSVQKALESLGTAVTLTRSPDQILKAERIVLPGVGAFGDFMAGLRADGLDQALLAAAAQAVPMLGICVGMQALFEVGEEMGEHRGLGLLPGRVVKFVPQTDLQVPHTGWNQLWPRREFSLFGGLSGGAYAYFNHSYYCVPARTEDVDLENEYGLRFASAVQRGGLFGVQFHPEKSQAVGLQLLSNFLQME